MDNNIEYFKLLESKTKKSSQYFETAKKSILGGIASALHKGDYEPYPIFIESGKGSKLYDVDGNEYIDYVGGFGPTILGYCPQAVNDAVIDQASRGAQFAAPTKSLNDLSDKIASIVPCAELVSYQSTGTEACIVAVRFARAYTGKNKIIKFEGNYHGWSEELYISTAASSLAQLGPRNNPWKIRQSAGQTERVTEDVIILPWNDLEVVEQAINRHGHEIAAVILEPVMCNCEPIMPKPGYLEGLRKITADNDVLLIFDEIITGFRLALGGAQEYYKVKPDISTFGKAAAGGFQIAGVVGRKEVMQTGVNPVGTFNGNPIAVAACQATIRELEKPLVYENMARITKRLIDGVNEIGKKKGVTLYSGGLASIWQIEFGIKGPMSEYRDNFKVDKVSYQKFRTAGLAKGIRFHPTRGRLYVSAAHSDKDVDKTLMVIDELIINLFKTT